MQSRRNIRCADIAAENFVPKLGSVLFGRNCDNVCAKPQESFFTFS